MNSKCFECCLEKILSFFKKFSNDQETIFKKLEKIKVSFQEFTIYTFFMNSKCFECYLENYAFFRKLFLLV